MNTVDEQIEILQAWKSGRPLQCRPLNHPGDPWRTVVRYADTYPPYRTLAFGTYFFQLTPPDAEAAPAPAQRSAGEEAALQAGIMRMARHLKELEEAIRRQQEQVDRACGEANQYADEAVSGFETSVQQLRYLVRDLGVKLELHQKQRIEESDTLDQRLDNVVKTVDLLAAQSVGVGVLEDRADALDTSLGRLKQSHDALAAEVVNLTKAQTNAYFDGGVNLRAVLDRLARLELVHASLFERLAKHHG